MARSHLNLDGFGDFAHPAVPRTSDSMEFI